MAPNAQGRDMTPGDDAVASPDGRPSLAGACPGIVRWGGAPTAFRAPAPEPRTLIRDARHSWLAIVAPAYMVLEIARSLVALQHRSKMIGRIAGAIEDLRFNSSVVSPRIG